MRAYISKNADKKIIDALEQGGIEIKSLAPFSALSYPVDTHSDMLLLMINDTVFVHKDYKIDLTDFKNIIKIDEPISNKYPNDVLLNIAVVGKNAFCNTKHASKTVLKYLEENNYAIHHVAQGYAHCSTCIVSESALISADLGIVQEAQKAGIDALLISNGHISLPPYNYGFIGGSCGSCGDKIYFCGSLEFHPDGNKIRQFCEKHGKNAVELLDAPLIDIGGILFK
jgi:ferredoxin